MQISGHKTGSMERRYNILVDEDVREPRTLKDDWFQEQKMEAEKQVTDALGFVVAEVGVEPTCPVKDDRF
jgi:hypothetical protein